jgi:sirohydrochlorin cobaltochelatase
MEKGLKQKNAIVLAMFGTSVEPALAGLLNIRDKVVERFPQTQVRIAFTSNIIRRIWQQRALDLEYIPAHPEVPADILNIQGPLATIANLQDEGFDAIVVQPVHIAPAEEYVDLTSYVTGLNSINTVKSKHRPFANLVLGRPALGTFGTAYPYADDIVSVASSLAPDATLAEQEKAALFYMGHGNRYYPSSGVYLEFVGTMRKQYPNVLTVMSLVEGFPDVDAVIAELKAHNIEKVLLKPFMVVAGDHIMKNMIGNKDDTLESRLEREGFVVKPVLNGLGEQDMFAQIFVDHTADAARDAAIELS